MVPKNPPMTYGSVVLFEGAKVHIFLHIPILFSEISFEHMTIWGEKQKKITFYCDFEEFGRRIGLTEQLVNRELDFFASEHPLAQELIHRSFLPEKLQRYYWQSFNYRRTLLAKRQ